MPVHVDEGQDHYHLAAVDPALLQRITAAAAGANVRVESVVVQPFPYSWGAPATAGLWRVDVAHEAGTQSYFVKLLRHVRRWPGLLAVPEQFREELCRAIPWRFEYDICRAGIADLLPDGMRTPTLHYAKEIDDDHVALWWEFVEVDPLPWQPEDFARAAYLLGRLAARRRQGTPANARIPLVPKEMERGALRYFVEHRILIATVGELHALRAQPVPGVPADLVAEMLALAGRLPGLLDRLDRLPQTYAHGDASPQNLLIPVGKRSERVVIDWGFGTLLPIGFDLGQLLVGLAHAGELAAAELPAIDAAIFDAYLDGLADEDYAVDPADVRLGYVGSLTARSALASLGLDEPGGVTPEFLAQRVALTRALVDMAQSVA